MPRHMFGDTDFEMTIIAAEEHQVVHCNPVTGGGLLGGPLSASRAARAPIRKVRLPRRDRRCFGAFRRTTPQEPPRKPGFFPRRDVATLPKRAGPSADQHTPNTTDRIRS